MLDESGKLLNQQPMYDNFINAEVSLQLDDRMAVGKVTKRAVDPEGQTVGVYDDDPRLNSVVYEVEFKDGQVKEYAANVIAENMMSQVDIDGYSVTRVKAVVDHRKDPEVAVAKEDGYVTTKSGIKRPRKTTKGWQLMMQWGDDSESWVSLKDAKESHPVEVAEYAIEEVDVVSWRTTCLWKIQPNTDSD